MTQQDPTPAVPVFRLVRDTTDLPSWVRYRLGLLSGLIEPFVAAVFSKKEMN